MSQPAQIAASPTKATHKISIRRLNRLVAVSRPRMRESAVPCAAARGSGKARPDPASKRRIQCVLAKTCATKDFSWVCLPGRKLDPESRAKGDERPEQQLVIGDDDGQHGDDGREHGIDALLLDGEGEIGADAQAI